MYVGMNCPLRYSIEIHYNPELPEAKALAENLKRQLKTTISRLSNCKDERSRRTVEKFCPRLTDASGKQFFLDLENEG